MGRTLEGNVGAMYTHVFIEYGIDGFRWKIYEIDGVLHIDYQEWVAANGEWETRSEFDGPWISDIDKWCSAFKRVAELSDSK